MHSLPIVCPQGERIPNFCSMWFIGLVFEKTSVTVDLTYDISSFTKAVHYQAENNNMLRGGMTIEVGDAMIQGEHDINVSDCCPIGRRE